MDQLANAAVCSPLAQATQDGQTSSENFPTSHQLLMWELIRQVSRHHSLAPSEVLRRVSTGELAVNLPEGWPKRLREEFHRTALNPMFGCWLMGWTSTWVIAEPHALSASATESFRCALRSQLSCLLDEPEFSDRNKS